MVRVEIIYVPKDRNAKHITMDVASGTTVESVLLASGIYDEYPETKDLPVGIYSKKTSLDTIVKNGDRLEIYRPLQRDPKEKRRQLARKPRV